MRKNSQVIRIPQEAFDLLEKLSIGSDMSIGEVASTLILGYDKKFCINEVKRTFYELEVR